ncbi:unnamed protein product, partial [Laminaria digitata]
MEEAHPQPRGWLSWLRYPLWNSPSPPPTQSTASTAPEQNSDNRKAKGLFFPFLSRAGKEEEMSCPAEVHHSRERPEAEPRLPPLSQRKPRARGGPLRGGRGSGGRGSGMGERIVRVSRRRASPERARELQLLHKD